MQKLYTVKEMMLGMNDTFNYFQCVQCECLQIVKIPFNIEKYYPENYYSLKYSPEIHFKGEIKQTLKKIRDSYIITGKGFTGRIIQLFYPNLSIELYNFRKVKLKKKDKILDVGSGSGIIPYIFFNAGFVKTIGIDPYISNDITYENGLTIKKIDFLDLNVSDFDVIMYNHSFEHLSNPIEHLQQVYRSLKALGKLIIRIPTVSSFAWNKYGVNWVQLDAPRHIFLYSIKSLVILADQTNFKIDEINYESTYFQFAGSEQYLKGIALHDQNSYYKGNSSLFSEKEIKQFKRDAILLNKRKEGDSIFIILSKKN
ncbi:MAG: class I SAM-dependent methyltransferase [Sediminibacterium sp.]|nr:class I SAM-dependent methyltransferase [Sediminibacterium sp.]